MNITTALTGCAIAGGLALTGVAGASAAPIDTPGPPGTEDTIALVPFEQATVVDPNTVTLVQGGVIAADGTSLCTVDPGSIVFPDGRYPCFIDFNQTFTTVPGPALPIPQIAQVPIGGVDTGAAGATAGLPDRGLTTTVAALAVLLLVLRRGFRVG